MLLLEIDFNSDEALYMQLYRQIIMGIANSQLQQGEPLPSVRDMAENIGINMHTVNKAYSVLKEEGYLRLDRRRGAVVYVDEDKQRALEEMDNELSVILAKAVCRNVSRDEVHAAVDRIFDRYEKQE